MHEHAYYGRGNTIHSLCQIESFHNKCDDKSHHIGGKQVIPFLDGYATPLDCRSGLMYMSTIGKPTDQELGNYPHVLLTSPHEWNPYVHNGQCCSHHLPTRSFICIRLCATCIIYKQSHLAANH